MLVQAILAQDTLFDLSCQEVLQSAMVWSGRPPGLYWQRNFVLLHAEGGDTSILVSPVAAANLTTVELLSVTLPDSGKTVVFATAAIFGKTAAISAYLPDSGKPVQVFLARLEKLKKMLRFCVITQSRWWQLQLEAAIAGGVFVKVDQVVKVYVVVKVNVV